MKYVVLYEDISKEYDTGHFRIKVKVNAGPFDFLKLKEIKEKRQL